MLDAKFATDQIAKAEDGLTQKQILATICATEMMCAYIGQREYVHNEKLCYDNYFDIVMAKLNGDDDEQ